MIGRMSLLAALLAPTLAFAGDVTVTDAYIPLTPPGMMAQAAYMTLTNSGDVSRNLIGVSAEGYAMVHIHRSEHSAGVATMSSVDVIEIAPGQSVELAPGGLHIMLMHPKNPQAEGAMVPLSLRFADGEVLDVSAEVKRLAHGS